MSYWEYLKFNFIHFDENQKEIEKFKFLESTNILRIFGYIPLNNQEFTFVKIYITVDFDDPVVNSFIRPFLEQVPYINLQR